MITGGPCRQPVASETMPPSTSNIRPVNMTGPGPLRHPEAVPNLQQLRDSGPERVTNLLTLRPDVLGPPPPRSLSELAARLAHPVSVSLALSRLPQPALEVAEALAALGTHADRTSLEHLLGLHQPGIEVSTHTALSRELERLSAYGLLTADTVVLESTLLEGWPSPLNLHLSLHSFVPTLTVAKLTEVLATWQQPRPEPPRKAPIVEALLATLTDGDRVRAALADAPDGLLDHLLAAAFGQRFQTVYGYSFYSGGSRRTGREHPLTWALDRLLLVPSPDGGLVMPREAALALRGPLWHAPFTPEPPAGSWVTVPEGEIQAAGAIAGAQSLQLVAEVLRQIDEKPLTLRKDGDVGAREIRRLAKLVSAPPEQVRWVLALTHQVGLLTLTSQLELNQAGRRWLELSPAPSLAALAEGWWSMADLPTYVEDLAWGPGYQLSAQPLRQVVLRTLADHPGAAAADPGVLVDAVLWAAPVLLGGGLSESDDDADPANLDDPYGDEADAPPPGPGEPVISVLTEAEYLGVVAAGALSAAGRALLDGSGPESVAAAFEATLGPAQEEVVLQADLTATVLGQPSGRLTTVLNRMAERESRSAATIWRFSAASVRRALDAGHTGEEMLTDLADLARGEVPQALAYLVQDVARQHGRLRAGSALTYLRCADEPLLAEVAADRRLRRLSLRLLAPTVLISSAALADLLVALRAAGYSPVEESPDGATVLRGPGNRPDTDGAGSTGLDGSGSRPGTRSLPAPLNVPALVAQLLKESDRPRSLIDLGQTVIDVESLNEYLTAREQDQAYRLD